MSASPEVRECWCDYKTLLFRACELSLPDTLYGLRFFPFAASADHLYHSQAKPSCLGDTPYKYKAGFGFCCKDGLCF